MKPHIYFWPAALLLVVLACGLMACESEEAGSPTVESTGASASSSEPTVTASNTSAAPTQAESGTTNETGAADTSIPESTNAPVYEAVPVDTPSPEETPTWTEGSSSDSSGYWVVQSQNTNNFLDELFPLVQPTVLDAAQYRNPDGTYSYEGLSFADCDAFGTYAGSSTQAVVIVTNCGTSAFP